MRHGEDDMLPVAVGQDVLLLDDPLFGAFEAAAAAGFGLATLTEEARMGTVRGTAAIASHAHSAGTTGEHTLDREFGPVWPFFSGKRSWPSSCWNRSFAGRGMYMKHCAKYDDEGEKYFGCAADGLTPQACYRSSGIMAQ